MEEKIIKLTIMILISILMKSSECQTNNYKTFSNYEIDSIYRTSTSGVVIKLPQGTAFWDKGIIFDKGVTIIGEGNNRTIIKWVGTENSSIFTLKPKSTEIDKRFRISGLTIDMNSIENTTAIKIENYSENFFRNVRIDHNKIIGAKGSTAFSISINGSIYGLIDNNEMPALFKILGHNSASLKDTLKIGSINYLYIEDNIMYSMHNRIIINSGWGSRWVFRYNKVDISSRGFNLLDAHGNLSSVRGVVGHDIYENCFTNSEDREDGMRFHDLRGGTAHIYNNILTGNEENVDIQIREEDCTSANGFIDCIYPGIDPIKDTYVWNNVNNNKKIRIRNSVSNDSVIMISENIDFWDDYDTSESNFYYDTMGTNRNWVVNDCFWDSKQKKLYRCKKPGVLTLIYEEFEYPHPFQELPPVDGMKIK
ncbi:MAG: hypothetical protein GX625_10470 [Clostridiaceae bacterium]|nr:hypothetical protein [Clostridiaceae bacterium]